jgi:hypothetical protein
MKSGTAIKISFCIMPKIRIGRNSKKLGSPTNTAPAISATPPSVNATGKPDKIRINTRRKSRSASIHMLKIKKLRNET